MLLVQLQRTGAGSRGCRPLSAATGLAPQMRAEELACLVCARRAGWVAHLVLRVGRLGFSKRSLFLSHVAQSPKRAAKMFVLLRLPEYVQRGVRQADRRAVVTRRRHLAAVTSATGRPWWDRLAEGRRRVGPPRPPSCCRRRRPTVRFRAQGPRSGCLGNARFASDGSRSMRAATVACSVAGTLTSAASAVDVCAPGSPRSTPRSASFRTISSAKNGLPAGLSTIVSPSPVMDGSGPSSSPISDAISELLSGARAIVCAPCTRLSAPSYSGR